MTHTRKTLVALALAASAVCAGAAPALADDTRPQTVGPVLDPQDNTRPEIPRLLAGLDNTRPKAPGFGAPDNTRPSPITAGAVPSGR